MKKHIVHSVIEKAGGQTALARALGIRPQAVQLWSQKKRIPVSRVLAVEQLVGVSRHRIRPDVYPQDPPAQKAG